MWPGPECPEWFDHRSAQVKVGRERGQGGGGGSRRGEEKERREGKEAGMRGKGEGETLFHTHIK